MRGAALRERLHLRVGTAPGLAGATPKNAIPPQELKIAATVLNHL